MSGESGDGKIIRPVFGKGRAPVQASEASRQELAPIRDEGSLAPSLDIDTRYYKSNVEIAFDALTKVMQFDTFVRSLRGYVQKDSNVALRRQGLKGTSLQGLIESVSRSVENDWQQKPAYYRALFEELSDRIAAVRPKNSDGAVARHGGTALKNLTRGLQEDCLFVMVHSLEVQSANGIADISTNYIFDELADFVYDRADLNLRRQGLKAHRLEDLVKILNASGRKEWAAHPHFYGAVILELNDRLEEVRPILKQLGR